ncbi:hypothetical protein [Maribacter sp. 2304DJ31-5]|uniref:hypothetical protein n=1 Tax=Maribacter sp. 2304DJ31-5 TaxID=3386273 RepID=UPI0039BCB48C
MKEFTLILLSVSLLICSCKKEEYTFEFEEIESNEADWVAQDTINTKFFRGQTWKQWRGTFKDCMQSKWIKKPFYFGPSNTVGLGSISSKNYKNLIWTFDRVFSEEEKKKIIQLGTSASCEIKRKIELDLETTLEGELKEQGSANINFALDNAKSTTTSIDGFQVDNLIEGELRIALRNSEDERKKEYLKDLTTGNNVLLNRVVRVSGFTSEIELNNEMSADLEAELANNPELELGDAGVKVKFSKKNETTIIVKSLGNFVVFGKFVKGKKVQL